jgi:heptaprenyl diphosphate synthase
MMNQPPVTARTIGETMPSTKLREVHGPHEQRSPAGIIPLTTDEIVDAALAEDLIFELAAPAEYLLSTIGKRLRSTLLLHCANAGPYPGDPSVRKGAIAIELFHLATLAHDDVVDDGKIRRGADTVGVVYGSFASGFLGGALCVRATELMVGCGSEITGRLADTAGEVCTGQMIEFEDLFDVRRSVQRYELAAAGKTGSLFGCAAWLGARLAGAQAPIAEELGCFGKELGMAFQVADDVLDLIAPSGETGKQHAKDLQRGIYTLPVIHAIEADAGLSRALEGASSGDNLPELVTRIERGGGIERSIGACVERCHHARSILREALESRPASRYGLEELLDHALEPIAAWPAREASAVA